MKEHLSRSDKTVPDGNRVNVEFVENSNAYAVDFQYPDDESGTVDTLDYAEIHRKGTRDILQWIRNGINARAKEIRLQAAFYYFDGEHRKTQKRLADEIGVRKATINQKVVEFKDHYGIKNAAGAASEMRDNEGRQEMSRVCKQNHQQRKNLSKSAGSQTRSITNTKKRSGLREKVLNLATPQ